MSTEKNGSRKKTWLFSSSILYAREYENDFIEDQTFSPRMI
jgi:hypothetical protein